MIGKKGEAKPRNYLIGLVLAAMVSAGFLAVFSEMAEHTTVDVSEYNSTFSTLNQTSEVITDMESDFKDSTTTEGTFGFLNALITLSWGTAKLLLTQFGFVTTMLYALQSLLNIPVWAITGLLAIISIVIIFGIMRAILQSDQL